jgi:hypothetical protein
LFETTITSYKTNRNNLWRQNLPNIEWWNWEKKKKKQKEIKKKEQKLGFFTVYMNSE